jgi:CCR4-NOT transcription complex subunit 7/8
VWLQDTEFPGIVARPIGKFPSKADYHYQTLRCNVDMLKIIQLGITLADENGELAKVEGTVSTWQFNFRFSLEEDMYAQDSIDLLTKSGIDFMKHTAHGIDVYKFGELLITSGLVMLDEVKWISFHSGYDFGYLVKIMSCTPLPKEEVDFRIKLKTFFPSLYDIKYLMKSCRNLKGGLQDIAEEMGIHRIGPQHQAGSDSLLTGQIFFEMRQRYFEGKIDDALYLYVVCRCSPR